MAEFAVPDAELARLGDEDSEDKAYRVAV